MESILETQAVAEARLFELLAEMRFAVDRPELRDTVVDELLDKPLQLSPYSENPLEDGIEPEMVS